MGSPRICPHCGAQTYGVKYCGKCGNDLSSPPPPPSTDPLSPEERHAILQEEIERYVGMGYRVVSQTDTTAQMVKPKTFSCLWALIWMLLLIGIVFYLIWYLAKRDEQVYLSVDEFGGIKRHN